MRVHLINDKCVSIEMTPHDTMSLSLSQQRHHNRLGLSLSKSGHGMVHLLLIVNPSPSLQFLRDPGLVSHTLSPCCLNNKPLTPRLELIYMTILTARWALYLKINKCLKQQICFVICQNIDTWHYGNLRENFKTSKQRHQNQNGTDDLEWKWNSKKSAGIKNCLQSCPLS